MKISIIGVGKLGGALAIALSKRGFEIENLLARNLESAKKIAELVKSNPKTILENEFAEISSAVILITTQDFEIENVAQRLKENLRHQPTVFHTSGSLSSDVLKDLRTIGCKVGSIHPLISISDAGLGAERFADAYYCVEGDDEAVKVGNQIVERLGGKFFSINAELKTLYHASATAACGHLVALVDVAIEMLTRCGIDEANSQKILLPLIKSTVGNLETQSTAQALTGTVARADVKTLENHIETLEKNVSAEAREIYLQLAARSVHLAERQGANALNLEKIRGKLLLAKNNLR
ncbi:MAG: DUF2520 domain-containing protein [Acidobacteriota bacterium]|nr:DUF2520 domain-containing protein [Acidobacteriota bacterium]